MDESTFSPYWYRVSQLQPQLRKHAEIHRHFYGGEIWYVLQDHVTGKLYRFTPVLYHVIGLMDGKLTVHLLWEKVSDRYGDDAPTQGDIVRVLGQLHSAGVLLCDVPPDTAELLRRHEQQEKSGWKQNIKSPLSQRFSLFDPDKFLSGTVRFVRPCFSLASAVIWLAVVVTAIVLAAQHWSELTENMTDRVLSAQNLVLLWFVYPVIKVIHEFGHGYAVKVWGGRVHEMGIMFMVLMPMPYVDASSASAFPERRRRIIVSSAGIMVELFVAALALFLWLNLEPGIVRAICYNVMLIASISSVLFNGNPLLRYDGYYVLSDALEIPNLAQRSQQYVGHLTKRYILGLKNDEPPHVARGERFWLSTYCILSFVYRMFVYAGIILFIAGKFFFIGVILAVWALASMIIIPAYKKIHFVMFSPLLREKRTRAVSVSGGIVLSVILLLLFMPFPYFTRAEGVVWTPDEALVRAGTDGFVVAVETKPDSMVKKGDILIRCRDSQLEASVKVLRAELRSIQARYDAEVYENRVQASITKEEIANVRANLESDERKLSNLIIRSPGDGVFILPDADDMPGRYVRQGDLVAYVLDLCNPLVRVVVSQRDVDLVRERNRGVDIRFAENLRCVYPSVIKRQVPGVVEYLPSAILSSAGGGEIAVDPSDSEGLKPLDQLFQFDVEPVTGIDGFKIGGRVYVRFNHGFEPLAFQWYRSIRQLFLKRFNV